MRLLVALLLVLLPVVRSEAAPRVVASIPPVHGLVAAVMEGAGEPALLIPAEVSPHDFALRPSDAGALAEAELVVIVGAGLEIGLEKAVETLAEGAAVLELALVEGIEPLPPAGHDGDHDHADGIDTHLWLDPEIARRWLGPIAEALAAADPANAALYRNNATATADRLQALIAETEAALAPLRGRDYAVVHDAYRYFERRFGLGAAASLGAGEGDPPGARRLAGMRDILRRLDRPCLFSEPQQDAALAATLASDSGARTGTLDPLGVGLEPGPELYPALIRGMARSFADCLTEG